MSNRGRESPALSPPAGVPLSTSPQGSYPGATSLGTSAPRAGTTARLASPIPSSLGPGTPPPPGSPSLPPRHGASASHDSLSPLPGAGSGSAAQPATGPGVSALAAAISN